MLLYSHSIIISLINIMNTVIYIVVCIHILNLLILYIYIYKKLDESYLISLII